MLSHPAWGEWIEMPAEMQASTICWCLTQHGVSGLKSVRCLSPKHYIQSHPAWGEWIEMRREHHRMRLCGCLTPHGVSGLKSFFLFVEHARFSLTPHGVSGLKFVLLGISRTGFPSHPAWGEWIEIFLPKPVFATRTVSPRMG